MVFPLIPLAMSIAGEFLPDLVRGLVGDKAGDVANKIVDIATTLTGKSEPGDIMSALKGNPDMVIELQLRLADERIAMAQFDQADRASARRMATKSSLHTWAAILVSVLVTGSFGFMLWAVLSRPIPEASSEVALIMLGTLGGGFIQVLNFWLGSSRGSQEKSQMLMEAGRR